MKPDRTNRDEHPQPAEIGRDVGRTRNAGRAADEPFEPEHQPQDDLFLHDDDEAELDLPRSQ